MRLVDMMMDYATCTVFRGQTSSMHSYRGHVTADSCYRGLYYTYIPVVSEAMTKCFENDRKSLLSVVLTKSLFTFLLKDEGSSEKVKVRVQWSSAS